MCMCACAILMGLAVGLAKVHYTVGGLNLHTKSTASPSANGFMQMPCIKILHTKISNFHTLKYFAICEIHIMNMCACVYVCVSVHIKIYSTNGKYKC